MKMTKEECAKTLLGMDNILVLAHERPDGDAVGSAAALCLALRSLGKNAVAKLDFFPKRMEFIGEYLGENKYFEPDFIVSTDTADKSMLGTASIGKNRNEIDVDLSIDHHFSGVTYAKETCTDYGAAAACELLYEIFKLLDVELTPEIADCLYLGISTDTGCFRYSNTTAGTFAAAEAIARAGAQIERINREQFETKSRECVMLEKMALSNVKMYLNDKVAVLPLTNDMLRRSNVREGEYTYLMAYPREIEGVLIGLTLKERSPGVFNISIRTNPPADASSIAQIFGGGGHKMAAGCTIEGSLSTAINLLIRESKSALEEIGEL